MQKLDSVNKKITELKSDKSINPGLLDAIEGMSSVAGTLTVKVGVHEERLAGHDDAIAGGYGPKEIAKIFSEFPEFKNLMNEKSFLSASDFTEIKPEKDIADKIKYDIEKAKREAIRQRIKASDEGYKESDRRSGSKTNRARIFEYYRNPSTFETLHLNIQNV